MDGPFRGSRPVERRGVPSRAQPVARPDEEPHPVQEAPRVHHSPAQHASDKRKHPLKRFKVPIIIAAIILLGIGSWLAWENMPSLGAGVNSKEYQAVFLSNGQVYFGKLTVLNGGRMKLTDVYYLQSKGSDSTSTDSKNPQQSTDSSSVQLIKLGSEIHGPEDEMLISKDQVLFYENLKSNSKVSQTIKQSKSGDNF